MPTHSDAEYQMVMYDAPRQRKKLFKRLKRKLAQKLKKRALISCIRAALVGSSLQRTIASIKYEVALRSGYSLDGNAMYVMFAKVLKLELIKMRKRTRKRRKKRFRVHFGETLHHLQECDRMWRHDDWPLKFSLMNTPCVKMHNAKLTKFASLPNGDSSDESM